MQIQKKYLITWIIVGVILLVSYYLLGGFTKVNLTLTEAPAFYITGKKYTGPATGRKLDSLVEATHTAYTNKEIEGVFSICFLGNPEEKDTLDILVGVMHDKKGEIPLNYIQEKFEAGKMITASIAAEAVVAPSASATNEKILAFAQEKGVKTKGIFIEKYVEDFKIVTVVPVE